MNTERQSKDSGDDYREYLTDHHCTLAPEVDIVVTYIDSGICVNTRRKFRSLLTVNENSTMTRTYLRSRAKVRQEKLRHLQYHYHMIHPFSNGRAHWEAFMAFVLFGLLLIIPIANIKQLHKPHIIYPKYALDILCFVDIGITFASGYYEPSTRKITLNCKHVARRYLKGYFLVDLLSSLPFQELLEIGHIATHKLFWLFSIMRYLKLLRLTTFVKYLDRLRSRKGYSIYKFRALKLLLIFIIALFWATSNIYLLTHDENIAVDNIYEELLSSCFKALYRFLLIGYGTQNETKTISSLTYSIIFLSLGVLLRWYIYAETLQVLNRNLSSSNKYQQMLSQLTEYVRYKQLPDSMRKRIYMYFEYRFEKNYYKESDIMNALSDNLRQEMILHSCQRLVESVAFFRDIPPNLLRRIVKCMKSEIFLTSDVIVRAGFPGDSMFFIASGTIAVFTSNGKEMCHLSDGGHFGEIALLMDNERRIASVIAVECCELYTLTRKDFRAAISPYPEFANRMRKLAQARLQKTLKYMSEEALRDSKHLQMI